MTDLGPQQAMPSALTATVHAGDGWPLPGAALTLVDGAGSQVARVQCDDTGAATVNDLRPGTYTAIITAVGYEPVARTTVVHDSGGATLGIVELNQAGSSELPEPGLWRIDVAHSSVLVTAKHLGISSIHGRFNEFSGDVRVTSPVEASSVAVRIDAASIDTANKMRDDHLRSSDFLNVERFPEITFRSTGLRPRGADRWDLDGELTLCGVTRPVRLDARYAGTGPDPWGGTRTSASATTELSREDFTITYNQALRTGIAAIGTTLRVDIDVQLVKEG